ncbi:hypothetical protein [Oceanobacillus rekensis]|uniref:hypothetical protein n=1 Tax=Oceanobacillus rekensis TaxID=937927 RepID=UPI000B4460E0|nr:hypothetical protein [Oceanobacillus rekensis]
MAKASNSKANRKGRTVSGKDVSEKEHTKLHIIIQDENRETSILRYFRNEKEKQAFIDYIKGVVVDEKA